nr:PREDICTED: proteinase-activated receptor 4-like [Lepisosteus oculatus]
MDRVEPSPAPRTGANLTGNASWPPFAMSAVVSACGAMPGGYRAWLSVEIVALVAGLPANGALFWLLLLSKSKWSFSQVLLANLAGLGALYCLCFPLDAYLALHPGSDSAAGAVRAFYGLNLFGCPLFLIVICLERCVALAPPGRPRALGHGWHRLLCAASLWALAASMSAFSYHKPLQTTVLSLVCFLPAAFSRSNQKSVRVTGCKTLETRSSA